MLIYPSEKTTRRQGQFNFFFTSKEAYRIVKKINGQKSARESRMGEKQC